MGEDEEFDGWEADGYGWVLLDASNEGGEDIATISRLPGHVSISRTMDVYAHLSPSTQRCAAERMDAILAG